MPIEVISAADSLLTARPSRAYWPTKPEQQSVRLHPMCLPAIDPSFAIAKDDLIFTIGSCFARNVEKQLIVEDYNVAARQFPAICADEGVDLKGELLNKFVVGSILNEVRWALDPAAAFDERAIVAAGTGDRFVDMQLAVGMLPASLEKVRAVRRAVARYMAMLRDAKVVVITLGLAEGWYDRTLGLYVNRPPLKAMALAEPDRFEMHVLAYDDIVRDLEAIIDCLTRFGRPDFRIVLTVSPVALGNTWTDDDALVANCYSKSVQRAAASYIYKTHDRVDYLPSYESVTLSDRRIAWRDDGAHVTDEAVRMNVLRMLYAYTGSEGSDEDHQKRAIALQLVRDADAAGRDGRPDDAMRAILLAEEIAPHEVAVCYRKGVLLNEAKRPAEAIAPLRKAYGLGGVSYGAAEQLGIALMRTGDPQQAVAYLEEAVAADLKLSKAKRHLADAYVACGDRDRAIAFLLSIIPTSAKKASLAYQAAALLTGAGRGAEALEMAELAAQEAPDAPKYATMRDRLRAERTAPTPALVA